MSSKHKQSLSFIPNEFNHSIPSSFLPNINRGEKSQIMRSQSDINYSAEESFAAHMQGYQSVPSKYQKPRMSEGQIIPLFKQKNKSIFHDAGQIVSEGIRSYQDRTPNKPKQNTSEASLPRIAERKKMSQGDLMENQIPKVTKDSKGIDNERMQTQERGKDIDENYIENEEKKKPSMAKALSDWLIDSTSPFTYHQIKMEMQKEKQQHSQFSSGGKINLIIKEDSLPQKKQDSIFYSPQSIVNVYEATEKQIISSSTFKSPLLNNSRRRQIKSDISNNNSESSMLYKDLKSQEEITGNQFKEQSPQIQNIQLSKILTPSNNLYDPKKIANQINKHVISQNNSPSSGTKYENTLPKTIPSNIQNGSAQKWFPNRVSSFSQIQTNQDHDLDIFSSISKSPNKGNQKSLHIEPTFNHASYFSQIPKRASYQNEVNKNTSALLVKENQSEQPNEMPKEITSEPLKQNSQQDIFAFLGIAEGGKSVIQSSQVTSIAKKRKKINDDNQKQVKIQPLSQQEQLEQIKEVKQSLIQEENPQQINPKAYKYSNGIKTELLSTNNPQSIISVWKIDEEQVNQLGPAVSQSVDHSRLNHRMIVSSKGILKSRSLSKYKDKNEKVEENQNENSYLITLESKRQKSQSNEQNQILQKSKSQSINLELQAHQALQTIHNKKYVNFNETLKVINLHKGGSESIGRLSQPIARSQFS